MREKQARQVVAMKSAFTVPRYCYQHKIGITLILLVIQIEVQMKNSGHSGPLAFFATAVNPIGSA